jgi:hypothetical protein
LAFKYPSTLAKRVLRTKHGAIELLATGQQFVAVGTHPSGVRYEWADGLPDDIPTLTTEQLEEVWSVLSLEFGIAASVESRISTKAEKLEEAVQGDPVAMFLVQNNWVRYRERDGRLHIRCPFEDFHTTFTSDSATTYFPAHTGGYAQGHFRCLHAHCEHRKDTEFVQAVGLIMNEFDEITTPDAAPDEEPALSVVPTRFRVQPAFEFASGKPPKWLIKELLPKAGLGVVFGASGSGKSFFVLDLLGAIARGEEWRGLKTFVGRCVYIAAEGAGGFRSRLRAYAQYNDIPLSSLDIGVIGDAPNFMNPVDIKDLLSSIKYFGDVDLVVVDTLAQVTPGANENSGDDMGKALSHCRAIHRHTGAMVLLVHHSGKDASKGARGWSGLRAAADVEIEIARDASDRVATVTKMKDWQDGTAFGFRLDTVHIGDDDDGDPITSCIVVHDNVPGAFRTRHIRNEKAKLVWSVVNELTAMGEPNVPLDHVLTLAAERLPVPVSSGGRKDARRQIASRAIDKLIKEGFLKHKRGTLSVIAPEEAL